MTEYSLSNAPPGTRPYHHRWPSGIFGAMESRSPPDFSLRDVSAHRAGARVLDGVSAELPGGRVSALVGASGSGKTSLLRLLNRLDEASSGSLRVSGTDIREIPVRDLRRRVGFVFQEPAVFPGTVEDNLRVALEVAGVGEGEAAERLREALDDAELPPDFLRREADQLSGGERQRVTLARALVLRPDALLLDEPTSALDPETADRIMSTIAGMSARRGLTVVVSTHRREEARRIAHVVLLLREGRLAATGGAEEVLDGAGKGGEAGDAGKAGDAGDAGDAGEAGA